MALGGLGTAVGGGIAAHHLRRTVPEQVLDIDLARVVGDSPGGEGVPEAMGMDARDARGPAKASQQLLESVGTQAHPRVEARGAGREEERPRGRTAVREIDDEGVGTAPGEGHDAVLAALALADAQPRSAQAQSARSNWTASAQRMPVSKSVRRIARLRRPTTVAASQQAIRRAISAGARGGTILRGSRTLRRPRKGSLFV